jgi:hypothetical protein
MVVHAVGAKKKAAKRQEAAILKVGWFGLASLPINSGISHPLASRFSPRA